MLGSAEYTPSTFFASTKASAYISAALSAAAVSVEKNGLPVPQAKRHTLPSFMARLAFSAVKSSHIEGICSVESTIDSTPASLRAASIARQFMAVASIPISSARFLSMPPLLLPLHTLPAPMVTPTSTPASTRVFISRAIRAEAAKSMVSLPPIASPESFNDTRLYLSIVLSFIQKRER